MQVIYYLCSYVGGGGGNFLFLNSGLLLPWIMQHVHLDSTEKRPKDYPKFSDYQSVFTGDGIAVGGFIICKKKKKCL